MTYYNPLLCKDCEKPPIEGQRRCQEHSIIERERAKRNRNARVARGECSYCNRPQRPNRTTCDQHAGKYKAGVGKQPQPRKIPLYTPTREGFLSLKKRVFEKLGAKCSNPQCKWVNDDGSVGCTNQDCLQIDHIEGGGRSEHRIINNRWIFLLKVLSDTTEAYQILCANCNWIKRVLNNENGKRYL